MSRDNLADEHLYSNVDNIAFTPELMDDVYLHPPIHVSTDKLADEHNYSNADNSAFTPELMDDIYLHPEQPIVFNTPL